MTTMRADYRASFAASLLLAFLFAILTPASTASALQPTRFDASRGPSCTECVVTFTKIAQLGQAGDDDFPAPDLRGSLSLTRDGNFVSANRDADRVLVYGANGKLVRVIGKTGEGPGEFSAVGQITLLGKDTILIGDKNRVHVFDSDFRLRETVTLGTPFVRSFVALTHGRFLTVQPSDRKFEPQPVVLGRGLDQNAPVRNAPEPECPTCNWTLSTTLRNGGAWLVRGNRNAIERWSQNGKLLRTATFAGATWFQPWFNPSTKAEHPYKPSIAGIEEDDAKRVWIMGQYLLPNAKPGRTLQSVKNADQTGGRVPHGGLAPNAAIQAQWVSVVDVFDPVTGTLYVSHTEPGKILRLLTPPYFAQPVQTPEGFDAVIIYRMDIRKR